MTFPVELTLKGALPEATMRPSAVAPVPVLVFVSWSVLPATGAESELGVVAVFAWPRMKVPPVAA